MASYCYLSPALSTPNPPGPYSMELESEMSTSFSASSSANGQKRKDHPSTDDRAFKRPLSWPINPSDQDEESIADDNTALASVQSLTASEYFAELQSEVTNDLDATMSEFACHYYRLMNQLAAQAEKRYKISSTLFQEVAELVLDELCKDGPRLPIFSTPDRKRTFAANIQEVCGSKALIKEYLAEHLVDHDCYPFFINCILQATFIPMGQEKEKMVASIERLVRKHGMTRPLSLQEIHLVDIYGFYSAYVNNNYESLYSCGSEQSSGVPELTLKELDSVHPKQWFAGPTDAFPALDLARFRSLSKNKQNLWNSILWASVNGGADWSKLAQGRSDMQADKALGDVGTFYYYSPVEEIDIYSPVLKRSIKTVHSREIQGYCGCCDSWIGQNSWRSHMRFAHGVISAIRQRVSPPRIMAVRRRRGKNEGTVQDVIAYCDQCQQWVDANMPSNGLFHPYEQWINHMETHLVNDFKVPDDHSAARTFLEDYYHRLEQHRNATKTKIHSIIKKWYDLTPGEVKTPFFSSPSNYAIGEGNRPFFAELVQQATRINQDQNLEIALMIRSAQQIRSDHDTMLRVHQ
ncbi:hypothetical protein TRVA0_042S01002 [Trichomonascus vanleenenianus]|uniref:uncharacterized protein n=1 Tax=Trichomonascus vanleenenianus TaxID=2268995 RepID=UPI003ECBA9D3